MSVCSDADTGVERSMRQYLNLMQEILDKGVSRVGRDKEETISLFGRSMRFDMVRGEFPLVTTRTLNPQTFIKETLWFLRGETNTRSLGCRIWDKWADQDGNLGPIYGFQWRGWRTKEGKVDQLQGVIDTLKKDPYSRRLVVSSWNVEDLELMALPPCHVMFQFFAEPSDYSRRPMLSLSVTQRSADMCIGVPFNIASYALILKLVATTVGMLPKELIWNGNDCHIYERHVEVLKRQLQRIPQPLPIVKFVRTYPLVESYKVEDIEVLGYVPEPPLKYDVTL